MEKREHLTDDDWGSTACWLFKNGYISSARIR
jgi:hypothetical protein